jgi:hypothetical protein
MQRDYVLETGGLSPYGLHRFVYALTEGESRPLFADEGETAVVRTAADLSAHAVEVRDPGRERALRRLQARRRSRGRPPRTPHRGNP